MRSLEAQRLDQLEAARYLLRQLRSAGSVWSDGQRAHRGEDLCRLRRETLARIIRLKEPKISQRRMPTMQRLCANLRNLPGAMSKFHDEAVADWMSRLLRDHCGANDTGSRERATVVRRLLRRMSPETFMSLPEPVRYSSAELSKLRQSRLAHKWVLHEIYTIPELGFILPKGIEVKPTMQGFCAIGLDRPHVVPSGVVRKKKPEDAFTAVKQSSEVL